MADISKIQLSDNTQYNLKDATARSALSENDTSTGDISKIQLSDNTQYNIKDAQAREDIETITTDVKAQVNADKDLINNGVDFIDDETLDDYDDKIAEMQEAYKKYIPIQTTSGTEITLDNSSNDKALVNIELDGNTEQETTTGYNLLDETTLRQGSYNNTSTSSRIFFDGNYYLSAGTYTLVTTLDTSNFRFAVDVDTNTFPKTGTGLDVYDSNWRTNKNFTFTINASGYLGVGVSTTSGTSNIVPSDIAGVKFMIYSGSYDSSKTYEPYTGRNCFT